MFEIERPKHGHPRIPLERPHIQGRIVGVVYLTAEDAQVLAEHLLRKELLIVRFQRNLECAWSSVETGAVHRGRVLSVSLRGRISRLEQLFGAQLNNLENTRLPARYSSMPSN
jgi:hypothetical protein